MSDTPRFLAFTEMPAMFHLLYHHSQPLPEGVELPTLFTYPFHYTPHPLAVQAAAQVQHYLLQQKEWQPELQQ